MKTFHKIKKAQTIIDPILGKDSMIGLIFQLFEGLRLMIDKSTLLKGLKTIQYVEEKLLKHFEGDDRNPFFEAVYMAYYHYYSQELETSAQNKSAHCKRIIYYLEKCLTVQLLSYGKYHSSVFNTYTGLADASFTIENEK